MFISHFTKWTWTKIYYRFYYSVYFKHIMSDQQRKKFASLWIFGVCFLPVLFLLSSLLSKNLFIVFLFLLAYLIIWPFIVPLTFLLIYSPKLLVCFETLPSTEEKEIHNKLFGAYVSDDKYATSINYDRNVMDKEYDVLLETKKFYLIYKEYKKEFKSESSIILVINKNENKDELGKEGQNFLDFILPKCKKYIKKWHQ